MLLKNHFIGVTAQRMVAKKLLVRKIVIYFSFAFCRLKGDRSHVLWLTGSWPFQLLILKGNHFQWIFAQWLKKCKVQEEFSFFFKMGAAGKRWSGTPYHFIGEKPRPERSGVNLNYLSSITNPVFYNSFCHPIHPSINQSNSIFNWQAPDGIKAILNVCQIQWYIHLRPRGPGSWKAD